MGRVRERTGDLVLLKDFYQTKIRNLNFKEKIIFKLTKWALGGASTVVFSTECKEIFGENLII